MKSVKHAGFEVGSEVPRPTMPFKYKTGRSRTNFVDATLETNILDIVYNDRRVTVRYLLNVIGKSYGTVHGCIWEHLNMKTFSARWVLCL